MESVLSLFSILKPLTPESAESDARPGLWSVALWSELQPEAGQAGPSRLSRGSPSLLSRSPSCGPSVGLGVTVVSAHIQCGSALQRPRPGLAADSGAQRASTAHCCVT